MADAIPPIDVGATLTQMRALAQNAAQDFVKGNIATVKDLGEQEGATFLSALFKSTLIDKLQPLLPLPENATADQLAQAEEIVAARDQQLMLVDAAEDKVASDMDALKQSALSTVEGLLQSILKSVL